MGREQARTVKSKSTSWNTRQIPPASSHVAPEGGGEGVRSRIPEHEKWLYAHRGASLIYPENTLEAFQRALEDGANVLEMDLHISRDGELMVAHDEDGRRMAGVNARIARSTLQEIKSWNVGRGFKDVNGESPFQERFFQIPTLDEVLGAFPGVMLNIDIKTTSPSRVAQVVEKIESYNAVPHVVLISFHNRVIQKVREIYGGPTGINYGEMHRLLLPEFLNLRPPASNVIQVPRRYGLMRFDTDTFIKSRQNSGYRVDFWTVDEPAVALELLRKGADGVMSNNPAIIAPVIREFETRSRERQSAPC